MTETDWLHTSDPQPLLEYLRRSRSKSLLLKTRQMDRLLTSYQALGIEFVQEQHGKGPVHYAAKVGPTVFEVYPLAEGPADSTTRLGFEVDDLKNVLAMLQVNEAPKKSPSGWQAVARDPDGRAVELVQQGGRT